MKKEQPEQEPLERLSLTEFSLEELLEEREPEKQATPLEPQIQKDEKPQEEKPSKKRKKKTPSPETEPKIAADSSNHSAAKPVLPHAGHRERLRQRFLNEGLDHFDDHNILELLLFFCIPQRDTNELAHRLMDQFGSFTQVFLADYEDLKAVKGMTANAAVLLKVVPQLFGRYLDRMQEPEDALLNSSEKIGNFLIPKFLGQTEEMVYLLCLNNACKLLKCEKISSGGLTQSSIDVRRLAEITFQCKAVNIVLAHNHPHGLARPSSQDIRVTDWLYGVLKPLGIELLDHFVVSGGDYVSMMEMGYLGVQQDGSQRL